jgi:L-asparaginase II
MPAPAVPLVRVVRSGLEESVHAGHVAVCDADGRLLAWVGDPGLRLFGRSCMKPLQGAVSLAAIRDLPLRTEQVAVICASHSGEPVHRRTVRAVLRAGGLDATALRTPPAYPEEVDARTHARAPSPIAHNCSGKHAGMLLACVHNGWDLPTYRRRSHPLQRRITEAVGEACGMPPRPVGVDGCGVPVHGVTLRAMATLYARLARPERLGALASSVERAVTAMRAAPYLVGGRGRLDTELMAATHHVLAKEGAEALACAADLRSGIGVAVKICDGGHRAAPPALLQALGELDVLGSAELRELRSHARPPVLGGGRRVGSMEPVFVLHRKR